MMEFIIQVIGFMMIWFIVDLGRSECCKIKTFSKQWWISVIIISIGCMLSNIELT